MTDSSVVKLGKEIGIKHSKARGLNVVYIIAHYTCLDQSLGG